MHSHPHPLPADPGLTGPALYGASSAWWLVQSLAAYGPSWQALGPLLMGVGAVCHGMANLERARRGR